MTKNWDDVWQAIRELYVNQGKSLGEVQQRLKRDWNFDASVRAYRLKIKEWGFQRRAASRKGRLGLQNVSTEAHNLVLTSESSDDPLRSTSKTACSTCGSLVLNLPELFQAVYTDSIDRAKAFLASTRCKCCINNPLTLGLDGHLKTKLYNKHRYLRPLHVAAASSSVQMLQLLIDYGAEIDARSIIDRPLHYAIRYSRPLAVEALLLHGAAANQKTGDIYSPLYTAVVEQPSPSIVKLLIEHGADVDEDTFADGKTLLQDVLCSKPGQDLRESSYKISKTLLESGASIASNSGLWTDPLTEFLRPWQSKAFWYCSLSEAALSCFATFIKRGAFIEIAFKSASCKEDKYVTLLHEILFHTPGSSLARMLVDNADVGPNGNGTNILHTILNPCPGRHVAPSDSSISFMVARLLSRGANPNESDPHGYTPLTSMLYHVPEEELSDCLDAVLEDDRTDPKMVDERGQHPINIALRGFEDPLRLKIAEKLLSKYTRSSGDLLFAEYFPIDATYWRYAKNTPFWKAVLVRLPDDIAEAFATAIFGVSTRKYLDALVENYNSIIDFERILGTIDARASYGLPEHKISLLHLARHHGVIRFPANVC